MDNERVVIWRWLGKNLPLFTMSRATVIAQNDLGIVPTTDELSVAYRVTILVCLHSQYVCDYRAGGILSVSA